MLFQPADTIEILQIHVFTNVFVARGVAQSLWVVNQNAGRL